MKINTVLGSVDINLLGNVLSHEHILIYSPSLRCGFGEDWFNLEKVIKRAVILLKQVKEQCGVDTIIDGTPLDLGRNLEAMQIASEKSGVNIIASSGMYFCEEYSISRQKPENFARYFIDEFEHGINRSGIKPSIIKCATGDAGFTPNNRMLLDTMSIVQRETNAPMYAHSSHAIKTGYEQLEIFEKNGVNLEKIVIGHCSDTNDITYLLDLAQSGCYLGFDRIYPGAYKNQAKVIYELIKSGYEDKILVSHDFFAFTDSMGLKPEEMCSLGRDFTTVHKMLLPELKKCGASDLQIHKLTYENPRNLFL